MNSAVGSNIVKASKALSNPFIQQRAWLASSVVTAESKDQDEAWNSARPFREVPGPTMWELFKFFRPGGSMANMEFFDIVDEFQRRYGNICKLPGVLGKSDMVFVYDPNDVQKIFRNEGKYPERRGFDSLVYYRTKIRPGIYAKSPGLTIAQGKEWWEFRQKVNPVMMQPKAAKVYVPIIDQISKDFVNKIQEKKDSNDRFSDEFLPLLSRWALESVCSVSLNLRIGLMEDKANPVAEKFMINLKRLFEHSYELDILPSVWMYYKTPLFKAMVRNVDEMHDNAMYFLEQGKRALEEKKQLGIVSKEEDKGVLEKLLEIDESVALVMTLDSIIAGVDTTGTFFFHLLHTLALNPEKQEILRKEILTVLPNKDSKLTAENTRNMPYLRACIKESSRYKPFFDNLRSAGRDMVLQGYQIPKSTNMSLALHSLLKSEDHYLRSAEFLPERFLRNEKEAVCPKAKEPNPFIFLPFGYGPRMCIGRRFAELEIETLIANMLRQFRVHWDGPPPTYLKSFGQLPVGKTHFTFTELKD